MPAQFTIFPDKHLDARPIYYPQNDIEEIAQPHKEKLINAYLETVHVSFPIVSRSEFDPQAASTLRLASMYAWSHVFCPEAKSLDPWVFLNFLGRAIPLEARNASLDSIEAALLYSQRHTYVFRAPTMPGMMAEVGSLVGMAHRLDRDSINHACSIELHASSVHLIPQPFPVLHRPIVWINGLLVGNVVAHVMLRADVDGAQPEDIHAEVLEIGDFGNYAIYVADSIAIGVAEGAWVDLVDSGFAPPFAVDFGVWNEEWGAIFGAGHIDMASKLALQKPAIFRELTLRVLAICLFVSFGSINFGFDISWWASYLGIAEFKERYGVSPGPGEDKVIPSTWQSAGTGTPNAGMAIGCLIGGYANQWLGRKWMIALLSIIAIIGITLQVSVDSYWGILVGRTINGLSVGMEANVIPTYSAELAPPAIRGTLVGFYQWWQILGNILASCCIYGTSTHLSGQWTYKKAVAAGAWGSCTWATTAEAPTQQLREKKIMLATFSSFVMVILVTYINPYVQDQGYGDLGPKVSFVFGGCSILAMGWVAFFLPELKGRSLEELDEMFDAGVGVREFGK
ncbi:hypothetical protein BJX64DRAFT_283824 [Aspergillus heterothallicus]